MASERRFSDLELERALADDLPARRAAELERDATAADRARLDELRVEHASFLRATDVDAEVAAISRRVAQQTPVRPPRLAWLRWSVPLGALAAAALVTLIVMRRDRPIIDDEYQTKGDGVTLVIHVATGGASRQVHTGDTVQPGARLRFEVHVPRRGYIAIIGIGEGVPTIYYPFGGRAAVELDPRDGGLLPGAIALDASTTDERFFAVYGEQPFMLDDVSAALRDHRTADVLLHKRAAE